MANIDFEGHGRFRLSYTIFFQHGYRYNQKIFITLKEIFLSLITTSATWSLFGIIYHILLLIYNGRRQIEMKATIWLDLR